ncbi:MAG: acyltransferase [Acetobacteraceae bacterium]|nr:acyltransferase [Acetobacteraceae bacterium]MBV8520884.1 acyltransferase [Acetobacteraceae bacterium]
MQFYPIWAYFACMAALLALAATPPFAGADSPPSPRLNRLATLDGLRGFLALAVVFHHGAFYHRFLVDGRWEPPASRFYFLLGQVGVALFFMVTGYLFWSQVVAVAGRPAWLRLYVGRVFRIGPLYLAAVAIMLATVFAETGWRLKVPAGQLASQIGAWLALGFMTERQVNGYSGENIMVGVTWTLRYEWIFYLSLPLLALAARNRRLHLPLVLIGLTACLFWAAFFPPSPEFARRPIYPALFLTGMSCASLHEGGIWPRLPDRAASAMVLAFLALTFALCSTAYTGGAVVLLGAVFYLITSGCTVFGLLISRPGRRLGDISYGIYLLQGFALGLTLRPGPMRDLALASPAYHWILVLLGAAILIVLATAAHVWIERPGIALGKRLAARLERKRPLARLRADRDQVESPRAIHIA